MAVCYVALGGNVGDTAATLDEAIAALAKTTGSEVRQARRHASKAVGGPPGQGGFLNTVVAFETRREPLDLLGICQAIEARFGPRVGPRWSARRLDMDLIALDDAVVDTSRLRLPHPRMSFRPFVLEPFAELAPDWRHPELGASAAELWRVVREPPPIVELASDRPDDTDLVAMIEASLGPREGVRLLRQSGEAEAGLTIDAMATGCVTRGPRLRVADCDRERIADEIAAAVECVWPVDRGDPV